MITAPAVWPFDKVRVLNDALAVLRLDIGDPDAERINDLVPVACALCEQELDADVAPLTVPEPVHTAAVHVTVELYRRKDAPFGVTDAWSTDGVPVRISSDPLRGARRMLWPYKARFGLG
jgi:hypothetical protein